MAHWEVEEPMVKLGLRGGRSGVKLTSSSAWVGSEPGGTTSWT